MINFDEQRLSLTLYLVQFVYPFFKNLRSLCMVAKRYDATNETNLVLQNRVLRPDQSIDYYSKPFNIEDAQEYFDQQPWSDALLPEMKLARVYAGNKQGVSSNFGIPKVSCGIVTHAPLKQKRATELARWLDKRMAQADMQEYRFRNTAPDPAECAKIWPTPPELVGMTDYGRYGPTDDQPTSDFDADDFTRWGDGSLQDFDGSVQDFDSLLHVEPEVVEKIHQLLCLKEKRKLKAVDMVVIPTTPASIIESKVREMWDIPPHIGLRFTYFDYFHLQPDDVVGMVEEFWPHERNGHFQGGWRMKSGHRFFRNQIVVEIDSTAKHGTNLDSSSNYFASDFVLKCGFREDSHWAD